MINANTEYFLLKGKYLLAQKKYKRAELVLLKAVKKNQNLVEAWSLLGVSAFRSQSFDRAFQYFDNAIDRNPEHAGSYYQLGLMQYYLKNELKARTNLETAISLGYFWSPIQLAKAYFLLGHIFTKSNEIKKARNRFKVAFVLDKKNKKYRDKLKELKINPRTLMNKRYIPKENRTQRFIAAGMKFFDQGKYEKALDQFYKAYKLDKKNYKIYYMIGKTMEKFNNPLHTDTILQAYEKALGYKNDFIDPMLRVIDISIKNFDFKKANYWIRKIKKLKPYKPEVLYFSGLLNFHNKLYPQAKQDFINALTISPYDENTMFKLAETYARLSNYAQAIHYYVKLQKRNPANLKAYISMLLLYKNIGRLAKAIIEITKKNKADPKNPFYLITLGLLQIENGDLNVGLDNVKKAVTMDKKSPYLRELAAMAFGSLGKEKEAIQMYSDLTRLDNTRPDGMFKAAEKLFKRGKYKEALEKFIVVSNLVPRYPAVNRYLSKINIHLKKYDQAILSYEREVKYNPRNMKFKEELCELYMKFQKNDKAEKLIDEILNQDGKNLYGNIMKARFLVLKNRPRSALIRLKLALKQHPNDATIHRELGFTFFKLGKKSSARNSMMKYLNTAKNAVDRKEIEEFIKNL